MIANTAVHPRRKVPAIVLVLPIAPQSLPVHAPLILAAIGTRETVHIVVTRPDTYAPDVRMELSRLSAAVRERNALPDFSDSRSSSAAFCC
jgi:hypothetical protein